MVELLWNLLEQGSANTVVLRAKGNIECLKKCKTFSFSRSRFLSVHVIIFLDSAGNQFQCFQCVIPLRVRSLNPINVNKTNFWCPQTNNRIPFVQVFVEVITKVGKFQISYRRRLFHNFWWVSALFPSSICGKTHRRGSKCLQRKEASDGIPAIFIVGTFCETLLYWFSPIFLFCTLYIVSEKGFNPLNKNQLKVFWMNFWISFDIFFCPLAVLRSVRWISKWFIMFILATCPCYKTGVSMLLIEWWWDRIMVR